MTLRVRLNVGALSRAVGESEQASGPAALDELVIPFLDIGPYLVASPDPAAPIEGIQIAPLGRLRELTVDPAAGAHIIFVPPANRAWKVLSIHSRLVAAAGGATRLPRLFYALNSTFALASDRIVLGMDPVSGQAGGETVEWTWASGSSRAGRTADLVGVQEIPPGFWVIGDGTRAVGVLTASLAAGDNWELTRMQVEEFVTLP